MSDLQRELQQLDQELEVCHPPTFLCLLKPTRWRIVALKGWELTVIVPRLTTTIGRRETSRKRATRSAVRFCSRSTFPPPLLHRAQHRACEFTMPTTRYIRRRISRGLLHSPRSTLTLEMHMEPLREAPLRAPMLRAATRILPRHPD